VILVWNKKCVEPDWLFSLDATIVEWFCFIQIVYFMSQVRPNLLSMCFYRATGGLHSHSLPAITDSTEKGVRRNSPAHEGPRLRQLEGRVNVSEQSNKALLEELVRLQGELKGSIRRNEDTLREEREERLILSEKIRAANNLYTQMMMRMARAEEKIESEHNTVGTLVNHTKQVEQALMGNQQQLLSRREQIHVHVERVKDDMEDMRESQEQLQKNMRALTDDVRTMKSKHEVQTVQFGTLVQEIRQRIKKIEGDTNTAVSTIVLFFCRSRCGKKPFAVFGRINMVTTGP